MNSGHLSIKRKQKLNQMDQGRSGDRWGFVNILPDSGFIHTVHNGPRNQEEADKFTAEIKAVTVNLLFLYLMAGAVMKNHLKSTILHLSQFPIQGEGVLVILFVKLTNNSSMLK